jgi:hypothetical protein
MLLLERHVKPTAFSGSSCCGAKRIIGGDLAAGVQMEALLSVTQLLHLGQLSRSRRNASSQYAPSPACWLWSTQRGHPLNNQGSQHGCTVL